MKFLRLALVVLPLLLISTNIASAYKYTPWNGYVILNYNSVNAVSCGGVVAPNGYPGMNPQPNVAGTYGLNGGASGWFSFTCSNIVGSATAQDYLDVSPPPSVNYFGADSCTIPIGGSNCATRTYWSIAYAQNPRIYINGDWNWSLSLASTGDVTTYAGTYGPGSQSYTAWDVNGNLQTLLVNKSCATGSAWNGTTCVAPSINYFGATSCTIPVGSNDCSTHVWWGINNPIAPRVYLDGNWNWAWTGASGDYYHNFGVIGPGTHSYTAWDQNDLQTINVTKTCASGSAWNGSICSAPVLSYFTGTSCTIPAGQSNCNVHVTWSISYPQQPRVYIDNSFGWAWGTATGDAYYDFGSAGPSSHSLTAWDQKDLQTISVSKSCASGSAWNGSVCVAPTLNYLTATNCTIPVGSNDCGINITWSISNAQSPIVYIDGNQNWGWAGATGNQTTGITYGPGTHTFTAYDTTTGTTLGTKSGTKTCDVDSQWDGSTCAPASGSLSISPSPCTIPASQSTCTANVTYAITNTPIASNWVGGAIYQQGPGGTNSASWIPYAGVTFQLKNGTTATGKLLAQWFEYGVCAVDTGWDGAKCSPASGTINASPTTCVIPVNGSTCSTSISFTTQYTNWAQVWVDGSPFLGGTSNSGTTYNIVTNGAKAFYLRNGNQANGTLLGQVNVTGKCTPGSMWNGSVCAPVSGTISANPQQCTIPVGSNTCSTAITYSTANTDGAKVYAGNTLFATGLSGSNLPYNNVSFGSVVFTLRNASSDGDTRDLATVTVSGVCTGANEFDSSKSFCVPPTPVIDSNISPSTIPYGGPVSITWSIKYPNNTCKVAATLQRPPTCNAACQADVTSQESALNSDLSSGTTNQNDPNGQRPMSSALTTTASSVYAKGIKTVNLKYSTEFQFTCGAGNQPGVVAMPAKAIKKMIYVTNKNEG